MKSATMKCWSWHLWVQRCCTAVLLRWQKKYNVKLVVRSSMSEAEGTEVKEDVKMERMLVSGVAADKKVSRISIMGINDEPGKAFEVFSLMAKEKVSVDIILQSTGADGKQNISFTIGEDDLDIALKALEKNKERLTAREIVHDENTAKLSIVGAGMATTPVLRQCSLKQCMTQG